MSAQAPGLWPHAGSPFHADSLNIQQQLGIAERLDVQGDADELRSFDAAEPSSFVAATGDWPRCDPDRG